MGGYRVFARCARPGPGSDVSASVPEVVDIVVEADRRAGGRAACATAHTAATALDPHDVPVEALSIRAVETQPQSAGEGGRAAAAIGASSAGARAVPLCRRASAEGDSDRFLRADGSLTLLSLLVDRNRATIKMTS